MLSFGNPLGLLALLAIPAILAIHFLQRESRRAFTSTLFLLEQLAPESAQGRRFQQLRNSVPLWLQLLCALLLTWLLVQPRWLSPQSTHRVAVVLDSSVSMTAFRDQLLRTLETETARLAEAAAKTEWHLSESDTSRPALYIGTDRAALVAAVLNWKPHLGTHDFHPALQMGQALLRGSGTVVFVTDRAATLPEGVRLLAVGEQLENCGFAGATLEGAEWRVLVRNHGRTAHRRAWWVEAKGQQSPKQELTLEPGRSIALSGPMPPDADACELVLSGDGFALDDRLPIVLPQPKRLHIATTPNAPFAEFFAQLKSSIEAADTSAGTPDLHLSAYDPFTPALPESSAIVFVADPAPSKKLLPGEVVAENHALNAESNWSGLLCRETLRVPAKPGDQTLVWQGDRPLIFLRENGSQSLLVVNFDVRASNATRLPAFVLMLHRFVEQIRAAKVAPEARNVQTNQLLSVASDPSLPPPAIGGEPARALRAPAEPGFFEVKQGDTVLLRGAAQFADAREADFREAATVNGLDNAAGRLVEQNSEPDFLAPLWALLLSGGMVASWVWRQS